MNERTSSDRLLRAAPLVLRWGIAAVLIYNGVNQAMAMFGAETGESFLANGQGVELTANWASVLGIGQLAVGGLLFVGLFTRLTSLGVLGLVSYCVLVGSGAMAPASAETAELAAQGAMDLASQSATSPTGESAMSLATQLFQTSGASLLLLAAACGSLLVSGAGCLGLDTRHHRRLKNSETATV